MIARAIFLSFLMSLSFFPLSAQSRFDRIHVDDGFLNEISDGESNEKQLSIRIGIHHDLVTVEERS